MRFGLVHRIMTDALAALGVLAVVSTASMSPWTNGLLLLGLVLALAIPEKWQSLAPLRHFSAVAPIALFVVQGARLVAGRSTLDVAVEFAALLQIIRLATRRGAAHDQQIIVLALLHFVAGTVLGGGLTYGICFLGFLIVAPGALVLSHLRREVEGNYRQGARDRTGLPVDVPRILRSRRVVGRGFLGATCLISLPILAFTLLLFLLFPRVGLSLLLLPHPGPRMIGFTDHVDLGEVGVLRNNPAIALRFDVPDLPEPRQAKMVLRLRGTAFDSYDGRAWARTASDRHPFERAASSDVLPLLRRPDPSRDRRVTFDLESIDPPVVFLPPRTVGLEVRNNGRPLLNDPVTLVPGPEGEVRYAGGEARGLHYDAFLARESEQIAEQLAPSERPRYLTIPSSLPARIAMLAHEWADGQPTDYLKAKVIEEHLRTGFKYDVASPSGGTKEPLDHFLFESKRGHCEFFSTAMAMMLRDVGIPSRNVTGFVGGTYNNFGHYYAVREGDAHSWVEAYIDDPVHPGWQTFDPTPPAGATPFEATTGTFVYIRDFVEALSQRWNRYVVGYDLRTQIRFFEGMTNRYDTFRSSMGLDHGVAERLTRAHVLAAIFIVVGIVAYTLWRRREARPRSKVDKTIRTPDEKRLETAAGLYRSLELTLSALGLARPAALPPLRHAERLGASKHPLADEVLALTQIYLEVRFGGRELSAEATKEYERRVQKLKTIRVESAVPAT